MLPRSRLGTADAAFKGAPLRTVRPMDALTQALRGAASARRTAAARADVLLVVGAGGVLGSALLARALASGRFGRVQALVAKDLASALRGFEPLPQAALGAALRADTAVIVFERARRSNGRDEAFVQPQPEQLARAGARAARRRRAPAAGGGAACAGAAAAGAEVRAGLARRRPRRRAGLRAVAVRARRAGGLGSAAVGWAQRLAAGWLSQLAWMVPQREQPVRAQRLAELAVELAWRLPQAAPATRVLPPELLWQAAQSSDGGALLSAWLAGDALAAGSAAPAQRW